METQVPEILHQSKPNLEKFIGETQAIEIHINDSYIIRIGKREYKKLMRNLMELREVAFRKGLTIETFDDSAHCRRVMKIYRENH